MRDEHIFQLKAEMNHLTTFSTDETERLEKVGMWIQKICELTLLHCEYTYYYTDYWFAVMFLHNM